MPDQTFGLGDGISMQLGGASRLYSELSTVLSPGIHINTRYKQGPLLLPQCRHQVYIYFFFNYIQFNLSKAFGIRPVSASSVQILGKSDKD